MHLPLLSRILFLLFQFLILTMALPAAKHNVGIEDLTEREAGPLAEAEKETAADDPVRRTTVFGRRVRVDKPGTPVKAMVRSPDREVSGAKGKEE